MVFAILLLITAAARQPLSAQRVHISGRITDENGAPVELATVYDSRLFTSTVTNLQGRYELDPAYRDTIEIVFRMVGHEIRKRTLISPSDTVVLDVMLPTSGYALEGVTISEMRRQMDESQTFNFEKMRLSPDASGGAVESILVTQAGVSSHSELSNQYNVRGGNFDENIVYVNGTEIMRPLLVRAGQQEGLSFVNPDMVGSITFSSGGFSAMYADKMASVLDITYRKPEEFESSVSASLLGASIYVGTGNSKFSISNSLRYKSSRYLLGTLDTEGEYNPNFLDYQIFTTWIPSDKWELSLIGNIALNSYQFTPTDRETSFGTLEENKSFKVYFDGWEKDLFRTFFGTLSVKRKIDELNSITFGASSFRSNESETFDILSQYWLDENDENMGIGSFMEHARNTLNSRVTTLSVSGQHRMDANEIRWGLEARGERINEKMREWETRDSSGYMLPNTHGGPLDMIYALNSEQQMESSRISAYLMDTWRINSNRGLWRVNGGVRISRWDWNNELIASPRLSIGFIPASNEDLTLRLSGGWYYQTPFYKELKDTTVSNGIGTVELNRNIKSQKSLQAVIGGDYDFRAFNRQFKFTVEAYYKRFSDLIPYSVDNVRIVYYGENCASGYACGIDTKLFGEFVPGADSWLTFSVMKTEECIGGKWIPRPTDQRYNFSFYFTDFFPKSDKWRMTLKGCLSDGLPFGPSHSKREESLFRAPAYKRVDIGMSYLLLDGSSHNYAGRLHKSVKNIWLGLDCFNLFGINNVNSYYWITDVNDTQFAVPNYLTGRQVNFRILAEF